ncbi:MAG TPA: type II secretion system protein N [Rubrivivax sp.]
MKARWLSFVIWAAVAASAVFWALRLLVPTLPVPAHAATVSMAASVRSDLSPLLGGELRASTDEEEPVVVVDSRYQLLGVVSPRGRGTGQGLALIAVDGKPAKAYRVGAAVDEDNNVLQSVTARGAAIGPKGGVAAVALELPALAPAATGTMPPPAGVAAPTVPRALPPRAFAPPFPRTMPAPAAQAPMVPQEAPAPELDSRGRMAQ